MAKRQAEPPRHFSAEGHRGGSFVQVSKTGELDACGDEILNLRVGSSCVITVDQNINAAALAGILTRARDIGFDVLLREYMQEFGYADDQLDTFEPFAPQPKRRAV